VTKGSDLLVAAVENEGVACIFAIPGEEKLDVLESLRRSKIKLVLTRHEQAAGFMAEATSRMTGKAALCIGTTSRGPRMTVSRGVNGSLSDAQPASNVQGRRKTGRESAPAGETGTARRGAQAGGRPCLPRRGLRAAAGRGLRRWPGRIGDVRLGRPGRARGSRAAARPAAWAGEAAADSRPGAGLRRVRALDFFCRLVGFGCRRFSRLRFLVYHAERVANLHVVALLVHDAREHAVVLRADVEIHLVRLQFDDGLARLDVLAFLLAPLTDGRFDDGLTERWHDDVE